MFPAVGLWIISPSGKHLGVIAPKHSHSLAQGGENGKTLYMTAQGTLYRMALKVAGIWPGDDNQKFAVRRYGTHSWREESTQT